MIGFSIPITEHDLLDANQCSAVRDVLLSVRPAWTSRASGGFFTLGACAYLDASRSREGYFESARASNSVLQAHFAPLLERVRSFLEDFVGESISFDTTYALPGFHIFPIDGEDRTLAGVAASAHFDLQWQHLLSGTGAERTLSFTLPIEIPSGGASMEVWHARYNNAARLGISARDFALKYPSQKIEYRCGRIVLHDGLILHAIGRASAANPHGMRITLQGHGVRSHEGWLLYW